MLPTLAVLAVAAAAPQGAEVALPQLRLADLERWRELVRPTADEAAYLEIPWIPSFAEGMRRADAEQKPLLFWAMNGHPLGCT
jgi:hypothetical protein